MICNLVQNIPGDFTDSKRKPSHRLSGKVVFESRAGALEDTFLNLFMEFEHLTKSSRKHSN